MIQQSSPRPWRVNLASNIHDAGNRYLGQMYRRADALLIVESVNAKPTNGSEPTPIPNELMDLLRDFISARRYADSPAKGVGSKIGVREAQAALLVYCEKLFPQKVTV